MIKYGNHWITTKIAEGNSSKSLELLSRLLINSINPNGNIGKPSGTSTGPINTPPKPKWPNISAPTAKSQINKAKENVIKSIDRFGTISFFSCSKFDMNKNTMVVKRTEPNRMVIIKNLLLNAALMVFM